MASTERKRLPKRRKSTTYSMTLKPKDQDALKFHVTLGFYDDGRLGEVFVGVSKVGSFLKATLELWGMMASKALQHGMPASELVRTCSMVSAVPGVIDCEDLPAIHGLEAKSPWDAIAKLLSAEVSLKE